MVNRNLIREFDVSEDEWNEDIGIGLMEELHRPGSSRSTYSYASNGGKSRDLRPKNGPHPVGNGRQSGLPEQQKQRGHATKAKPTDSETGQSKQAGIRRRVRVWIHTGAASQTYPHEGARSEVVE